jgi:hypothetical protein
VSAALLIVAANLAEHGDAMWGIGRQDAPPTANVSQGFHASAALLFLFDRLLQHHQNIGAKGTPLGIGDFLRLLIETIWNFTDILGWPYWQFSISACTRQAQKVYRLL